MNSAGRRGVPPYLVLTDKSLLSIASKAPQTKEELYGAWGLGDFKVKQYGKAILKISRQFAT